MPFGACDIIAFLLLTLNIRTSLRVINVYFVFQSSGVFGQLICFVRDGRPVSSFLTIKRPISVPLEIFPVCQLICTGLKKKSPLTDI